MPFTEQEITEAQTIESTLTPAQEARRAEFLPQPKPENTSILELGNVPNLHEMTESNLALNDTYWTPEKEGETKLGFVMGIKKSIYVDEKTGEMTPLNCVEFVEQKEDLSMVRWRNGACKFVAVISDALESGVIVAGKTPVKFTYGGKTKTKKGNFTDNINVKLLSVGG